MMLRKVGEFERDQICGPSRAQINPDKVLSPTRTRRPLDGSSSQATSCVERCSQLAFPPAPILFLNPSKGWLTGVHTRHCPPPYAPCIVVCFSGGHRRRAVSSQAPAFLRAQPNSKLRAPPASLPAPRLSSSSSPTAPPIVALDLADSSFPLPALACRSLFAGSLGLAIPFGCVPRSSACFLAGRPASRNSIPVHDLCLQRNGRNGRGPTEPDNSDDSDYNEEDSENVRRVEGSRVESSRVESAQEAATAVSGGGSFFVAKPLLLPKHDVLSALFTFPPVK